MTERTTILIVDDESKIRRLLSRSLEAEGFDVAVADSAMSASEYLKNGHPISLNGMVWRPWKVICCRARDWGTKVWQLVIPVVEIVKACQRAHGRRKKQL